MNQRIMAEPVTELNSQRVFLLVDSVAGSMAGGAKEEDSAISKAHPDTPSVDLRSAKEHPSLVPNG